MAVAEMKRINVCALRHFRKQVLETLQAFGGVELSFSESDNNLEKTDTSGKRSVFMRSAANAELAVQILDEYAPPSKSLFASLEGKPQIPREEYDKIIALRDSLGSDCIMVSRLKNEITENTAKIKKLESDLVALAPWLTSDVSLGFNATKCTKIFFGTLSAAFSEADIAVLLADFNAAASEISRDKNTVYLAVIAKNECADEVFEALRKNGFSKPSQDFRLLPAETEKNIRQEIDRLEKENRSKLELICGFADKRTSFCILSDYYRIRADKYEVLGKISQSKRAFFLCGFVPARESDSLEKLLTENFGAAVEIEDAEDYPVLLENKKIASSFEGVLESFGLPKKGEFDPTCIMTVFYIFLFGLMLSDAAYGLIISVACFVLLKKFPHMEDGMSRSIRMFMYCGLSTLFWGIMFGGYFGDAVDVIARVFFGKEITAPVIPALWFIPLNNPMKLLLYSMLFGLIHLFAGLAIKGYISLKHKDYATFFFDVLAWFCLLAGLLIMLLGSSIYASLSGKAISFGTVGKYLSYVLTLLGAVTILLTGGRPSKNIGKRLAKGAYSLYDITSWLSDLLSYSRLLALGLATGVIASVINQMGSMLGGGVFGIIVFVIVFVIGHTFNLAINLLGAYVHTNRLQYVEFFGKFYEGGGKKFNPFKEDTKFVNIVNDDIKKGCN